MTTSTLPFEELQRPLQQIELLVTAGLMYLLFLLYLTMGLDLEMMGGVHDLCRDGHDGTQGNLVPCPSTHACRVYQA